MLTIRATGSLAILLTTSERTRWREKSKNSASSFLQTVKKYTDIPEPAPTILNELAEKIVVYQAAGTGRTQRLEIHYNFVVMFDTWQMACLPQSVMIDTRQDVAVEYVTRKAG